MFIEAPPNTATLNSYLGGTNFGMLGLWRGEARSVVSLLYRRRLCSQREVLIGKPLARSISPFGFSRYWTSSSLSVTKKLRSKVTHVLTDWTGKSSLPTLDRFSRATRGRGRFWFHQGALVERDPQRSGLSGSEEIGLQSTRIGCMPPACAAGYTAERIIEVAYSLNHAIFSFFSASPFSSSVSKAPRCRAGRLRRCVVCVPVFSRIEEALVDGFFAVVLLRVKSWLHGLLHMQQHSLEGSLPRS